MYDTPRSIEELLQMLSDAPRRIAELTEGLPASQMLIPPAEGEWSERDVLAHLRACSDMWGKYIRLILSEDRPTFKAVSPRTWVRQTNYLELQFETSFQAFSAQRLALVSLLTELAPEDWSRSAIATGAGKPRERTVYTYAQWLANHERSHFRQIGKIAEAVRG